MQLSDTPAQIARDALPLMRLRQSKVCPTTCLATLPREIFEMIIGRIEGSPRLEAPFGELCCCLSVEEPFERAVVQSCFFR